MAIPLMSLPVIYPQVLSLAQPRSSLRRVARMFWQANRRLYFLTLILLLGEKNSAWADEVSCSSDSTATNCGLTIDGDDTATINAGITLSSIDNAIYLSTDNNIINMTGHIITNGDSSEGIQFAGGTANNTMTLNGDITTTCASGSGGNCFGINIAGNSNTLTMKGNVSAAGSTARGLWVSGDSNTVSLTGNITSSADFGIIFYGDNNTVTTVGNILAGAKGIDYWGATGNTITHTGNITTTLVNGYGARSADDNTMTIIGNIITTDNSNFGFDNQGNANTNTTITGNISGAGQYGYQIHSNESATDTTTTVNGNLIGSGDQSHNMRLQTDDNTYIINGNLSQTNTSGISAKNLYGIGLDSNVITITGDISNSTTGSSGQGIYLHNSGENGGNTITVTGGISTVLQSIFYNGSNTNKNTSVYTGNISSSTEEAVAFVMADNNTTTISGNITSSDDNGLHFYNAANTNTTTVTGNISGAQGLYIGDYSAGNTTTITGNITATGDGLHFRNADSNPTTITGDITAGDEGMHVKYSDSNVFNYTGTLAAAADAIYLNSADSNIFNLSGTISTDGASKHGVSLTSGSVNNTLNLASGGSISSSGSSSYGIKLDGSSSLTALTNLGTISGNDYGIRVSSSTIATLNNFQSGLTYNGVVPSNYNIIIREFGAEYGKATFSGVSGTMAFGIDLTNSGAGIGDKSYQDVLTGIASSGVLSATTGTSAGAAWTLTHDGTNWDLNITGVLDGSYIDAPSAESTLVSIGTARDAISSEIASLAMKTNYANLHTYDCGVFDVNGGCFSIGGRHTDLNGNNNTGSSSAGFVAVGGFKVNDNFRVAGFIDEQINSNTPNGIKVKEKTPMMGVSMVWNQHPNHLGFQLKVANAYQAKVLDITRSVTGDAQPGQGETDIEVQSYLAEVSYQFADGNKTAYRPYFAMRRAIIKQDGYTETGVDDPLTFNTLKDKATTVIIGMKAKHRLNNKITMNASLGVEHDVSNDVDKIRATSSTITGLTPVDLNSRINKTRSVASIGATFDIAPNHRISVHSQYQELSYAHTSAIATYFKYDIGF